MEVPFLEALAAGGLVADGAMGSLLYERGVFANRNFDEVNLSQPELVYRIHREYLLAGAHLLESNTYGANRVRLAKHGLAAKVADINRAAMDVLRRATDGAAYLAGSLGPTGLSPGEVRRAEQEVRDAYAEQAQLLVEGGADVLVIETFLHPAELKLAVTAARAAVDVPIIAHIAATNAGGIIDGTDPADLAVEMHSWGANVVGANCNGPEVIFEVVSQMLTTGLLVSAMPNAGRPQSIEDRLIYLATPENFGVFARRLYKAGVKLVGGCCGTSPAHITRVSAAARMVAPRQRNPIVVSEANAPAKPEVPLAERSHFGSSLGRHFVVSVEVNPGPSLDLTQPVQAAQAVFEAGADVINIADGPRATARMSNLALAVAIQERLGREALLHICCRDRNLLGLTAHTLGAWVQGIRNLVVITGDPPKVGDFPDATAVYDVDSIGLLRMISGFNCGIDPAGKPMRDATAFVLATGAEPAALDFEREIVRLRQKVEAGAHAVMTQPIYDATHLNRFLDATSDLDVPVLVGILPLASYRNAEFIHNHIPGMGVPEAVRERMRRAGKGEAARREGVAIAVETLMGVRHRVAGAYIMPPLGQYELAVRILEALGSERSLGPEVPGRRS